MKIDCTAIQYICKRNDDNKLNWLNYERVNKRFMVLFPRLINIWGVDISYRCSCSCCESYTSQVQTRMVLLKKKQT